jgi:UDPglucose 6-dehydrogenase
MKIGVIGLGMVGETVVRGLSGIGHEVVGFDIDPKKASTAFSDLLDTKLVFVCVPTPSLPSGHCDTSIVVNVLGNLSREQYRGLVVIKSTIPPGSTQRYAKTYKDLLRLAFCPEFLRERTRFEDFIENHELCIAGVFNEADAEWIRVAHGTLPKHFVVMSPIEAELAKYFVNCFNAYRVNFANAFYDVCQSLGANYSTIKDAVTVRSTLSPYYLICNEQMRGFGGACLPKDTKAFAVFVKELGIPTAVFDKIVDENYRFTKP